MEMQRETVIKRRIDPEKEEGNQEGDKYAPHDRGRGRQRQRGCDGQRSRRRRGRSSVGGGGGDGGGRGGGQVIPVPQAQRGRGRGRGYRGSRDLCNLDPALRVQRDETWAASEDNGSFETEEEEKQRQEAGGIDEGDAGLQIGLRTVHPGQGRNLRQEAAEGAAGRVEQRGPQPGGAPAQVQPVQAHDGARGAETPLRGEVPQHGVGEEVFCIEFCKTLVDVCIVCTLSRVRSRRHGTTRSRWRRCRTA